MLPRVIQVNTSQGGLPKRPVERAVAGPFGLEGDAFAHPEIHGGSEQALLLVLREVVDELTGQGFPLFYGALGENLTVEGLDRRTLSAGQRYRVGYDVIIRLTKPRGPCRALDAYHPDLRSAVWEKRIKHGDRTSPYWGKSGFYAAVEHGGVILPGAPFIFLDQVC